MGFETISGNTTLDILTIQLDVPDKVAMERLLLKRLGYVKKAAAPQHVLALAATVLEQTLSTAEPRAVVAFTPVTGCSENTIHAHGVDIESTLWANLASMSTPPVTLAVFALTLGHIPDQDSDGKSIMSLSERYARHEAGSLLIERAADDLAVFLGKNKRGQGLRSSYRFSPGYCDIPLSAQQAFFRYLNPATIGVRLCDSGAMIPAKSLTAAILFAPSLSARSPCSKCSNVLCRHRRY